MAPTLTVERPDARMEAALRSARRSPGRMAAVCGHGSFDYLPHSRVLDKALTETMDAYEGRLIVSVTVRAGKSTLAARWAPAWYLGHHPQQRVILACHEAGLAAEHSGFARNVFSEWGPALWGLTVDPSSAARNRWDVARGATPTGGGMLALGVGGSPIGRGAGLMLVDDPLKTWEMAQSADQRRKVNEVWWQGTMAHRLEPGGSVIVICSRWHEDDLSGFLTTNWPGDWRELRLPAVCDDPDNDPMGRVEGESFWPEKWPPEVLAAREAAVGPRVWLAQFQQRPAPDTGNVFPVDKLVYIDPAEVPTDAIWCRGWDFAATDSGGDYTAGARVGRGADGLWYIADMVRGQWAEDVVRRRLRETAEFDGPACLVELPQDPGQAGKAQAAQMVAALAGYLAESRPQTGSKRTRAGGLAAQVQAGNVRVVRGAWNRALVDEMVVFDNGKHDDQVDAMASAFNRLAGVPLDAGGVALGAFTGLRRRTT